MLCQVVIREVLSEVMYLQNASPVHVYTAISLAVLALGVERYTQFLLHLFNAASNFLGDIEHAYAI